MNSNEYIKIDFNGIQKQIIKPKNFKSLKKLIQQCFNLTNEEYFRLILTYNKKNIIASDKDYANYISDMIYSNEPETILINIKPIVQSLKYDESNKQIYSLKYYNDLCEYNNHLLKKIEQLNSYKNSLHEDINKYTKNNILKKSKIITKKAQPIEQPNKVFKCKFLQNENEKDYTIIMKKSLISSNTPIKYSFKVENLGESWPNDTYIKCLDNGDIYFKKVGLENIFSKDIFNSKGEFYHQFDVEIFFENYNDIQIKKYQLKAYLESVSEGKFLIENNYGNLIIDIIDEKEDFLNTNDII